MTPNTYSELLEATIRHIEELKNRGKTFVCVSSDTLEALSRPLAHTRGTSSSTVAGAAAQVKSPATETVLPAPESRPMSVPESGTASISSKAVAMEALRKRAMECTKCAHLAASRKNVVFGTGNIDADLMFVGEAPGADEDRQGEPFVGAAGQLLNKIITAMGLRRTDVYIANILKCRPDTPGQTSGNRKPTPGEMATCVSYLQEQIQIVKPKVIVGLGATAIEGLLGNVGGISRVRSQWHIYQGTPLMPTFHPSFLLHNPANTEKRKVWEDMMKVMEKLGLPISEKQRGYFL